MQSSKSFAVPKMKLGIDTKAHLRFKPFLLIRGEVSACSCNPSGELVKVINIGIGGASKLTQGGIVLNVSPEVFNRLGSKDISRYLPNDCRDENRRPLCLKCE